MTALPRRLPRALPLTAVLIAVGLATWFAGRRAEAPAGPSEAAPASATDPDAAALVDDAAVPASSEDASVASMERTVADPVGPVVLLRVLPGEGLEGWTTGVYAELWSVRDEGGVTSQETRFVALAETHRLELPAAAIGGRFTATVAPTVRHRGGSRTFQLPDVPGGEVAGTLTLSAHDLATGRVIDVHGRPVACARVSYPQLRLEAATNAEGRFVLGPAGQWDELAGLALGAPHVEVDCGDYVPVHATGFFRPNAAKAGPYRELVVVVAPTGRLVVEDRRPANARTALRLLSSVAFEDWRFAGAPDLDGRTVRGAVGPGVFRQGPAAVEATPDGRYVFDPATAEVDLRVATAAQGGDVFDRVTADGVLTTSDAPDGFPLRLPPGGERVVVLEPEPRLAGLVVDANGRPYERAVVCAEWPGSRLRHALTDTAGRFELSLPGGLAPDFPIAVTAFAEWRGPGGGGPPLLDRGSGAQYGFRSPTQTRPLAEATRRGWHLSLRSAPTITGRVVDATGAPLERGWRVSLTRETPDGSAVESPLSFDRVGTHGPPHLPGAPPPEAGRFESDALEPGTYTLQVWPTGVAGPASTRQGVFAGDDVGDVLGEVAEPIQLWFELRNVPRDARELRLWLAPVDAAPPLDGAEPGSLGPFLDPRLPRRASTAASLDMHLAVRYRTLDVRHDAANGTGSTEAMVAPHAYWVVALGELGDRALAPALFGPFTADEPLEQVVLELPARREVVLDNAGEAAVVSFADAAGSRVAFALVDAAVLADGFVPAGSTQRTFVPGNVALTLHVRRTGEPGVAHPVAAGTATVWVRL